MNPHRNDILASNLLFATLLLTLGEYLFLWGVAIFASHNSPLPSDWLPATVTRSTVAWSLLFLLLRASLYYAVRRGVFRAKLLVIFFFGAAAYFTTKWQYGYVSGVDFHNLGGYSFLALAQNLLTLAALVLMFMKPQAAAPRGT